MRVLITGGTGTFGNAIVPFLLENGFYKRITIFSRDEQKQEAMARKFNDPRLAFFLGDVRDLNRLKMAMRGHHDVLHAAALKIVPSCEFDPFETVKTNVQGSVNVIDAALSQNVFRTVLISTDKACDPINLYGATKMTAERLFLAANNYAPTPHNKFSVVRYGNVTGSRGSVLPFWKERFEQGFSLPITDAGMRRFWLEPKDAADCVLKVLHKMKGREIFIPKMVHYGIMDLYYLFSTAKNDGAKFELVGLRAGEKIIETAIADHETNCTWEDEDHFIYRPGEINDNPPLLRSYTSASEHFYMGGRMLRKLIEPYLK